MKIIATTEKQGASTCATSPLDRWVGSIHLRMRRGASHGANCGQTETSQTMVRTSATASTQVEACSRHDMHIPKPCVAGSNPAWGTTFRRVKSSSDQRQRGQGLIFLVSHRQRESAPVCRRLRTDYGLELSAAAPPAPCRDCGAPRSTKQHAPLRRLAVLPTSTLCSLQATGPTARRRAQKQRIR
jgi:hypothetical protein